jgi:predicted DsbA family dithiol-disulfide isomerase
MMWVKSIYPMAARLGVKMRMPSRATRTRLAHEAAAWARSSGIGEQMNDALFRAYFERSENIGDPEVLVRLAADLYAGAPGLRESLSRHDHLPDVLADEEQARQYGLSGVPAFICNGKGLVGVQDGDNLARLVSEN